MNRVLLLLSFSLCLIFLYAGLTKVRHPLSFYQDVRAYHLIPDQWAWAFAHCLPWIEIVAGIALLMKPTRIAASLILMSLLSLFIAAQCSAWIRGLNIQCGCFGDMKTSTNYSWNISHDMLMLIISFYLFWWALKHQRDAVAPQGNL